MRVMNAKLQGHCPYGTISKIVVVVMTLCLGDSTLRNGGFLVRAVNDMVVTVLPYGAQYKFEFFVRDVSAESCWQVLSCTGLLEAGGG